MKRELNKNFSKSEIGLMGSLLINDILYMFLNTFMVAYFITLTNYNYKHISIYYVLSFIGILVIFLSFAKVVKNKNQIIIFRSGIILYCLYILSIALLKERIINYYMILGFSYGIVQGFFWTSGHVLVNYHTKNNVNRFTSFKSMIGKTLKIFFPIIFGTTIEVTSFSYIAKIIVILSVIQFIFSLFIEDKGNVKAKKYNLIEYLKLIKHKPNFKDIYKISCCDGIVHYLLETLITILIVMTFKTSISLGIITTIASICSIISVYIFQYKLKSNWKFLCISSIAMVTSVVILLISINKTSIIIYNLCNAIFLVLLMNTAETKSYEIINDDKEISESYIVEHQVTWQLFLNVSRIIGYLILFVVSLFNNIFIFKILLVIVTNTIVYYSLLLIKLKQNEG